MWGYILLGFLILVSVVILMSCLYAASEADDEMERQWLSKSEESDSENIN